MIMRKQPLILLLALFGAIAAIAQPSNDECTNPIVIPSVLNFCSANGAFTNVGATPSTYGPATCFNGTQNDVWFAFTAQATDVTITVRGATPQAPGGTLISPHLALYFGNCGGTINQLECQTDLQNIVEGYQGGLFVGSTYLIRVQGAGGNEGTFQLCINNYNPPVEPTSDCPDASILCDKSSFVVQSVTGAGTNTSELDDALCFSINGQTTNAETNSTWFVWTCSQSGSLEFTLSPLNVSDDLDFALYRLPNGIGNCQGKQLVRCMASGDFQFPSPCMGPTGLRSGDPDISEDPGCLNNGDDAWLAPFDMVQGESYALCVNNFTSTGNGFSIDFGGLGQFLGPEAAFTTDPPAVCLGTAVQVTDASSFPLGAITAWKWSFGADAVPQTATGPGPHTVQFNTPGIRPVVLTLETDLGCRLTDIQTVNIFPDVEIDTLIAAPDCNGTANGTVTINNIISGTPPYLFSWNGGPFENISSLSGLGVGTITLAIRDSNNCQSDFSIDVKERILEAEAVVDKPLCFGDDNGVITMNVTNGVQPIQFDFGNGFINQNFQGGFAAGSYTIQAIDDVLCKGTFEVAVTDNPMLELTMDTTDISCFTANDGMASANPSGGVGPYTYQWSNAPPTQNVNNLPPGQFDLTVTDANGCTITGGVFIVEPPDVAVNLVDVLDLLCNGLPTGEIRVEGVGGIEPYTFSVDGSSFAAADTLRNLPAGDYWVIIKDAGGCIDSVFASLDQPPPLIVSAEPADTTLDLGQSIRIVTTTSPTDRILSYLWAPELGVDSILAREPTIIAISSQVYTITITDQDGCTAVDQVQILVNKNRPMYFPNVFGPDKTYPNNFFTGFGGPAAESITLMRVYDRWGTLVFETRANPLNDPDRGWDGTYKGQAVDGVFTFYAFVRFIDGVELQYEGDITVVR